MFLQMMGHLLAVKEKQVATDDMFVPLRATIELLKTYGQELSEEVHTHIQVRIIGLVIFKSLYFHCSSLKVY